MSIGITHKKWKPIVGYEGYYEISNFGNVRSCERLVNHGLGSGVRKLKSKIITPWNDNHGYQVVSLSKSGKVKKYKVHRLVAEAFIPNPDNKPTINHINEIRNDNHVANLEWATYQENNNHGGHNQRVSRTLSKAVVQFDKSGNELADFDNIQDASSATGVHAANIKSCLHHANRILAGGYRWRYKT